MTSVAIECDGEEINSIDTSRLESLKKRLTPWHPYGNLKVLCNGHIVLNPVRPWWWIMEGYTVAITGIFFTERKQYNDNVSIMGVSLGIITFLLCMIVTLRNPGILKKPSFEDALKNAQDADWDHHCPIIGICISARNRFALYAMTASLFLMWTFYFFVSLHVVFAAGQKVHKFILVTESMTFIMILIGSAGSCILPVTLEAASNRLRSLQMFQGF